MAKISKLCILYLFTHNFLDYNFDNETKQGIPYTTGPNVLLDYIIKLFSYR